LNRFEELRSIWTKALDWRELRLLRIGLLVGEEADVSLSGLFSNSFQNDLSCVGVVMITRRRVMRDRNDD